VVDELQIQLKNIADKIPGCRHVSLVGYDGITVAQHSVDAQYDMSAFDAEISSIMLVSREVKENLSLAEERELIWLTDESFFIIQPIGTEYFVYACLKEKGSNPGAARIALTKAKQSIHDLIYHEA
jgi:predicted regulator of Ras-like GTPase activity (Roadblock/LC7/MglB family)